jgi:TorA maturation chaperone TorD
VSDENTLWRAQTYALLARLLSAAPDVDLLNNIAAIEVTEPESPMGEMWLPLINAAKEAEIEAVKEAFDTLFIGVTHGELIPYASFYRTGFLMEEPLAELRSDLAKLGLERQTDISEPEDHIAAICDVMRLILTAEGTPIVTSSEFFKRHIAPWGEQFFNDLASSHVAEFYTALGQFGLRFISLEARL